MTINNSFINFSTKNLDEFIINDHLNAMDLKKLAELNGIDLQIRKGWYDLTLALIKDLNQLGWDKKVTCIKEKWASLHFYTAYAYDHPIERLIRQYTEKSKQVCEFCGNNGDIRYLQGWEFIACRKHYLEKCSHVSINELGFDFNAVFYPWQNIEDAELCLKNPFNQYSFVRLYLKNNDLTNQKLVVHQNCIGYHQFLIHLPKHFKSLDYTYIQQLDNPTYCSICGYQAVYMDYCECCENFTGLGLIDYLKYVGTSPDEITEDLLSDRLKTYQIFWILDHGELFADQMNRYAKNPKHKILYTNEEFEDYKYHLEFRFDDEID